MRRPGIELTVSGGWLAWLARPTCPTVDEEGSTTPGRNQHTHQDTATTGRTPRTPHRYGAGILNTVEQFVTHLYRHSGQGA